MGVTCFHNKCISFSPPIRSFPHSLLPIRVPPRLSSSSSSLRLIRRRNLCFASSSSDTLVAAGSAVSKKGGEEFGDLKSWMHNNGLPPCKVVLKERPSHDEKHRPIHYVAASEDLEVGDVAFSVPNSLVVTLERVLGNETIAIPI